MSIRAAEVEPGLAEVSMLLPPGYDVRTGLDLYGTGGSWGLLDGPTLYAEFEPGITPVDRIFPIGPLCEDDEQVRGFLLAEGLLL